MPISDTVGTYTANQPIGYAGMIAESQTIKDVASKVVATSAVAFGLAVGRDGVVANSVKLGGTGFEGIAVADKTRTADSYAVGEVAGIIRKGTIWVTASTAVDPSKAVTFTAATGVIGDGLVTTITGAKFLDTASIGAMVRVWLP